MGAILSCKKVANYPWVTRPQSRSELALDEGKCVAGNVLEVTNCKLEPCGLYALCSGRYRFNEEPPDLWSIHTRQRTINDIDGASHIPFADRTGRHLNDSVQFAQRSEQLASPKHLSTTLPQEPPQRRLTQER
jgi:hypothetical protein